MANFANSFRKQLEDSKYEALSQLELNTLLKGALKGNTTHRDLILDSVSRMIWGVAEIMHRKQKPADVIPIEDYFQSGMIGAQNAFDQYNPEITGYKGRPITFITYLRNKAKGAMTDMHKIDRTTVFVAYDRRYAKKKDGTPDEKKRIEANVLVNRINPFASEDTKASYSWLKGNYATPSQSLERKDAIEFLNNAMDSCGLTQKEKMGVYGTFRGLHEDIESLDHVAEVLGFTNEGARLLGIKGLKKLQSNKKIFEDLKQIFYT